MKPAFCFTVSILFIFAGTLAADPIELSYDTGTTSGNFPNLDHNNYEAVCFSPQHPCSLLSARLRVRYTGTLELHIWEDNGAHEPDLNRNIVEPINVDIPSDRNWIEVDLRGYNIIFSPPRDFHIGHHNLDEGPVLWVDNDDAVFQERSHLWAYNDGLRQYLWHNLGDNGNYMVRAAVEYFDEREAFIFTEVMQDAGIAGLGNMAWGDYDNDGWEDLLVWGRILYHNNGDGTFTDVSEQAGTLGHNPSGTGTWGDFDNDGWLDFYACNGLADQEDRLYHNNHDGTFTFVNEIYDLRHGNNPTAACGWGDSNHDGYVDLYIANSENWNAGNPEYFRDYFYMFSPDFSCFLDVTPGWLSGLRYYGRSVAWCDFDFDGDMDVYISNYRLQPNLLLVNRGVDQWGMPDYQNEARTRNVEGDGGQNAYGHTIGSTWGDYDNDGDFDLLVGNFAHPWGLAYQDKVWLCRNTGAPNWRFENVQAQSGIQYCETVFCPQWGDYDNDGWLDLFISSVYDGRQPFLYRNNHNGTFSIVNYEAGFHTRAYNSNGVSWCDYDHDGDLDLAVGNGGLFLNQSDNGRWLEVVLRGRQTNRFAYGSRAGVHCGNLHLLRQVEGGAGAEGCQNMTALHYGLGGAVRVDSLVINWLEGAVERYFDLQSNRRYYAVQGEGITLDVPGEMKNPQIPEDLRLTSIYPNPFNSSAAICFTMGYSGTVKVEIWSLAGRKIQTLVEAVFEKGGHTLTWDAARLPAGNYIVQVVHSRGVVSRSVVLIK